MRKRVSYANVTATLALAVALGTGGAWAANSIHGSEIKDGTLRGKKLRDGTVPGRKITDGTVRNKDIAGDTLRGNKIREGTLGKVPDAADADTLNGIGPNGFVKGPGTVLAGHETSSAGGPPGPSDVIKSIASPIGRFELACGAANADTRYRNTTAGAAEVVRTVGVVDEVTVGEEPDDTDRDLFEEPSGNAQGVGYAATAASGPKWIELRVGKGSAAAIFTAFARRDGGDCSWTWDYASAGFGSSASG